MSPEVDPETRSDLLAACQEDRLLQAVGEYRWSGEAADGAAAIRAAADIHNAGDFDLLAAFRSPGLDTFTGHGFFTIQHFFCKLLPLLNSPVSEVIPCVRELVERGGTDLAANQPNGAFREWCSADLTRVDDALTLIRDDLDRDSGVLTLVLEAGASVDPERFVQEAIEFSVMPQLHNRLCGLTALGRIPCDSEESLQARVVSHLVERVTAIEDDLELANATSSLLNVYSTGSAHSLGDIEAALSVTIAKSGANTYHVLATALWQHREWLTSRLFRLILRALEEIDPANSGTIDQIDHGLSQVSDSGLWESVADYLHAMLAKHQEQLQLRQFDGLCHKMLGEDRGFLGWLLVRWLLDAEGVACQQLAAIVTEVGDQGRPFEIDLSSFRLDDTDLVRISRRAVGFLPLSPVAASSILVCAIRAGGEESGKEIEAPLFERLLINYPGAAREYLESIANDDSDPAAPTVERALQQHMNYLNDLAAVGEIPELHPSASERKLVSDRQREMFASAHREARKKSVFMSMVSHSTLLYGRTAASYLRRDVAEEPERQEMHVGTHGTSIEYPRLDAIDPVGLSYQIFVLRNERRNE